MVEDRPRGYVPALARYQYRAAHRAFLWGRFSTIKWVPITARGYEWGEAQADEYYNALFDRFEKLGEQPLSYPSVDEIREGYRRSVCGVDSIYYRIDGETVEIMAIIGRQNLEDWL